MTCYSVHLRDRIFVKGYRFFPFDKYTSKNFGKNLSSKYSQKCLDHTNQSTTDAPKTSSKNAIKNPVGITVNLILIDNNIASKIANLKKFTTN